MTVIHKRDELGFSFPTSHAGSSDSKSTTAISFSASLAKPSIEILLHQAEEHWLRESLIKERTGCRWAPLLPATLSTRRSQNQWGQGTVKNGPVVIKSDRGEKRERWKRGERPKHFWMSVRKYLTAKRDGVQSRMVFLLLISDFWAPSKKLLRNSIVMPFRCTSDVMHTATSFRVFWQIMFPIRLCYQHCSLIQYG